MDPGKASCALLGERVPSGIEWGFSIKRLPFCVHFTELSCGPRFIEVIGSHQFM